MMNYLVNKQSTTLGTATHGIGVPLEMVANPPTGDQLLKFARTSVGSYL